MTFTPPPGGIYIANDLLSDVALWNTQISLQLICGKNKTPLREKHRGVACYFFQVLLLESDRRGAPKPTLPVHSSAYHPIA